MFEQQTMIFKQYLDRGSILGEKVGFPHLGLALLLALQLGVIGHLIDKGTDRFSE